MKRVLIFDAMEYVLKMEMTGVGSLNMKEDVISTGEGIRGCNAFLQKPFSIGDLSARISEVFGQQ
jgi:hypothetical protein